MYNEFMEMNNNQVQELPINENPHVAKFNVGESPPKEKKPILAIIIGVVAAIIAFVSIWFFVLDKDLPFRFMGKGGGGKGSAVYTDGDGILNPITGKKVGGDKATEWKDVRPLAVMVNNHLDARPQSGLIFADFVYEIVAEGGITRFLAFYLNETPEKIGPVRSTREYYLVLVKEMGDAMLMHEGYSPQAKLAMDTWPVRSLFRGGASWVANWRDETLGVDFEHTLYTNGKLLREHGDSLGWGGNREFQLWEFDGEDKYQDSPDAKELAVHFWYEGDYSAIFQYDQENNNYKRFMGYDGSGDPIPHADRETGEQIVVENVLVQFVAESPIVGDDKSRLDYELIGSGSGLVFIDGKAVEATWTKESRGGRTLFYDQNGEQIRFTPGKFWICIVPDRNVDQVIYN